MEHSASWEANSSSDSQGPLPYSKEPATGPYSEPDESSAQLPTLFA
jgi:hypothetical protein